MRIAGKLILTAAASLLLAGIGRTQDAHFVRSDANVDGTIDISDPVFTLAALFLVPDRQFSCKDAADSNDDGDLNVSDAVYTLTFLFLGGPSPGSPFPEPGHDPDFHLGCERYGDDGPRAIIADHTRTDLAGIPLDWVSEARGRFRIFYGHTSHGSQILSGMEAMRDETFAYNGGPGTLSIVETGSDLGNPDFTAWAGVTRTQLRKAANDRNVVMWSWCGQVSGATEKNIREDYLGNMAALEAEFPEVTFIYMTGHLDGTGADGNLNRRNEQIREFCRANGKVLFDFADIESWDPDGNYYLDKAANDACDYRDGGVTRNWADAWCAAHPGQCSSCSCAHSRSLNCDRKARAFWWLMARLAIPLPP